MMQKPARILLSLVVATFAIVIVGLYMHRLYAPHALPTTTSAATDANDIRYSLHTKLSAVEKQHLFDGGCQAFTSTDALPQPIKNAFATITQDEPFALADPGDRFNATDVLLDDLPRRRLVLAAVCQDRWILEYERGGRGLSILVMVLRLEPKNDVHFVWGGFEFKPVTNLAALQDAIVSGDFHDSDYF